MPCCGSSLEFRVTAARRIFYDAPVFFALACLRRSSCSSPRQARSGGGDHVSVRFLYDASALEFTDDQFGQRCVAELKIARVEIRVQRNRCQVIGDVADWQT